MEPRGTDDERHDLTRIDDISQVRPGDIAVFENMAGIVVKACCEYTADKQRLYVAVYDGVDGISGMWMPDEDFRYALRRMRAGMPDDPGLYRDKTGSLWLYAGGAWRLLRYDGKWNSECNAYETFEIRRFAPFTRVTLASEAEDADGVDVLP